MTSAAEIQSDDIIDETPVNETMHDEGAAPGPKSSGGGKGSWIANMAHLTIAKKLPALFAVAVLFSVAAVGIAVYFNAQSSLHAASEDKMAALSQNRHAAISDYLKSIEQDLRFISTNEMTIKGVKSFARAWNALGADPTGALQKLYIDDNPHPAGKKENLDRAKDDSAYSQVHGQYHPWFRTFLRERGYYDIFLFDTEGNLVYTVFKELDYATNVNTGKWKDTDLGNVFRAAAESRKPGFQSFFDFKPYAPSSDAPAAFISTPLTDEGGKFIGVLVFQMPIDNINGVMKNDAGLGNTGESMIVGGDYLMRNDSRFSKESTILKRRVETEPVKQAIAGKEAVIEATDYRGTATIAAFRPLNFAGTRWALVTEISQEEVFAPVDDLRNNAIIIGVISLLVISGFGAFFARGISGPISEMVGTMSVLASGDKTVSIPHRNRSDEIGDIAGAVQVFKEGMIENERLQEEQRKAEQRAAEEEKGREDEKRQAEAKAQEEQHKAEQREAEEAKRHEEEKRQAEAKAQGERRNEMLQLADTFENQVGGIIKAVSSASTELQSSAQALASTAEEGSAQSNSAAAAAEQASGSVQTVASAAEELSKSVQEIGDRVSKSARIAENAVGQAQKTNEKVQLLAEAASKIGEVVNLINDIASQTNLLALNATIEAARAGEAGKGFAVVASEVKSLANQTAKATEEIGGQIGQIQGATTEAVGAIDEIGKTISEINEIAGAIASAVEQQDGATKEIASSANQAATGTESVTQNIANVSQAAAETGSASSQVLESASELSQQSEQLREVVDQLLVTIRAA